MKKLLLIIAIVASVFSCSTNNENNYSVLEPILGEWQLQSKVLNGNILVEVDNEILVFTEDNDFDDTKGNYVKDANSISSGLFYISFPFYNLVFENTNGEALIYDFDLNNATLELVITNDDGDLVSEVWTKITHQD